MEHTVVIDGKVYVPEPKSLWETIMETLGMGSICGDGILNAKTSTKIIAKYF